MSRPTLVQSLLKQPSQSYINVDASTDHKKEYYSTRQEMIRIAAQTTSLGNTESGKQGGVSHYQSDRNGAKHTDKGDSSVMAKGAQLLPNHSQRPSRPPTKLPEPDNDSDSELDLFFTPNSSPRTSMASSVATITFPSSGRRPSRRSLNSLKAADSSPLPLQLPIEATPKPTKVSSAVPSTRTPSANARNALSTVSSISSTSLDGHSVFSDYINSAEFITAPYASESGDQKPIGKSVPVRSTSTSTDNKWRNQNYTQEDWAKDVRWLVPPGTSGTSGSSSNNSRPVNLSANAAVASTATPNVNSQTASQKTTRGGSKSTLYAQLADVGSVPATDRNGYASKGKDREQEKSAKKGTTKVNEKEEMKKAMPLASNPNTTPQGRQKYTPPRQPHTFSAFASTSSPTTPTTTATSPAGASTTSSNHLAASAAHAKLSPGSNSPYGSSSTAPTAHSTTATRAQSSTLSPSTARAKSPSSKMDTTNTATSSKSGTTKYYTNGNLPSTSIASSIYPQSNTPSPPPSTQHPQRNIVHKPNVPVMPTITPLVRGMDAVLEEDEDGPLTPRMEAQTLRNRADGWDWTTSSHSSIGTTPTTLSATPSRLRHTAPDMRRRRSRSLDGSSSSNSGSPSNSNSGSPNPGSRYPSAPKTLTAEVNALVSSFESAGTLPSKGTQGYTGLVLPRAPPSSLPSAANNTTFGSINLGRASKEGKIDLARTGVAQTTMATVEVVRGLGASTSVFGFFGLGRKRSLSAGRGRGPAVPMPTGIARSSVDGGVVGRITNGHIEPTSTTPLGFTAYRSPPGYVPSGSVLVQVWAVGVDGVDGRLVGVRFGNLGVGIRNQARDEQTEAEETERRELEADADGDEDLDIEDDMVGHLHNGNSNVRNDDEDDDGDDEVPPTETTPTKKSPLAALGRSISLRLSRGSSGGNKDKKDLQRSASAAVYGTKPADTGQPPRRQSVDPRQISLPKRSFSLKRSNTAASRVSTANSVLSSSPASKDSKTKKDEMKRNGSPRKEKTVHIADVGYIPGRSFVGRVLECGWEVPDEIVRKGEWVVGLLDVRKGGALAEFIVVDRHRVHRVPHPRKADMSANAPPCPIWVTSPISPNGFSDSPTLSLEELALLPLCGLPAYRAVRTLAFAFSSARDGHSTPGAQMRPQFEFGNGPMSPGHASSTDHEQGYRRRALVLRGHDGAGAMAVQILVKRGWKVSVHVPFSSVPGHVAQDVMDAFMHSVEDRARGWGADEVIFDDGEGGLDDGRGAAVRVLESLREDGDVFDAVLDTVGGKDVWEAAERLLRFSGSPPRRRGVGQFTTLVGDWPDRVVPTAKDNLRSGFRAMRMGSSDTTAGGGGNGDDHGRVGYAWVSVAQDVDWEGDGVAETLGTVVRLAIEDGVRPSIDDVEMHVGLKRRVIPFEKSPYIFIDNGLLGDGGTVVVKIAG